MSLEQKEIEICQEVNLEITKKSVDAEVCSNTDLEISGKKKEYSIVGDSLYASITSEQAPQWLTSIIDDVVNSLLATRMNDLNRAIDSINKSLLELDVAKNQYQELINIDSRIDSVLASRLQTLNATIQQNSANIIELDIAKVTPNEALAISIDHVNAQINNGKIHSLVTELNSAIANNEMSAAQRIETIESVYNENESKVRQILSSKTGVYTPEENAISELIIDAESLQSQIDGQIDYYFYDSSLGQTAISVSGSATWTTDTLKKEHNGDVAYDTKLEVGYWYDRRTSSWVKLTETQNAGVIEALKKASRAQSTADGKVTNYYAIRSTTAPATNKLWMDITGTPVLKKYTTSWVKITPEYGDTAMTISVPVTENRVYTYTNGGWAEYREGGVYANAEAITLLEVDLEALDQSIYGSTGLENILRGVITREGARVESKFAYNSSIGINGKFYKSGFGLSALTTNGGTGTEANPYNSEFWINAQKFKFTNDNKTGQVAPFTIDASGTNPQITFNGKVEFTNINHVPEINKTYVQATQPTSGMIKGDTWVNTSDNNSLNTYNGSTWVKTQNGNKTYLQTSAPASGMLKGDTWIDTDDNNALYTYNGTSWVKTKAGATPQEVVNAVNAGNTTTINGGKITTGTITANQVNLNNLFAQNITYTGVITGGNVAGGGIIQSYDGKMKIDLVNGSIYIV